MSTDAREGGPASLLPAGIEARYRGHPVALWLLGGVLMMKTAIALGTLFNGRVAAQRADGIPLDTFGAAGAQAVVAMFAIWGLAQLAFLSFGWLALLRYRGLVPLVSASLLLEHLARRAVLAWKPIAASGPHPGGPINLALTVLMVAGLALSLSTRERSTDPLSRS